MLQKLNGALIGAVASISLVCPGISLSAIITSGCANVNVSCTLSELAHGATFSINDVSFLGWGVSDDPTIIVQPFRADTSAGLEVGFDVLFNPAFSVHAKGVTALFDMEYRVSASLSPLDIMSAQLALGTISGAGDFVEARLHKFTDAGPHLAIDCIAVSIPCSNSTLTTQTLLPHVTSLDVTDVASLFVQDFTGGNPIAEINRIRNTFFVVPEPGSILLFLTAVTLLGAVNRRSRYATETQRGAPKNLG